jgi:hypothetical protein
MTPVYQGKHLRLCPVFNFVLNSYYEIVKSGLCGFPYLVDKLVSM